MGGGFRYDDLLSSIGWEQYRAATLERRPLAEALAIADDELALYGLYLLDLEASRKYPDRGLVPTHVPSMGLPFSQNYPRLRRWFGETFGELLEQRIIALNVRERPSAAQIARLSDEFYRLMEGIRRIDRMLGGLGSHSHSMYYLTPYALRRQLRALGIPPELLEDVGPIFPVGSTFYWLELFARIGKLDIGGRLLERLERTDENALRRSVQTPLLRLRLWEHQRICFDLWNSGTRNGIVEMATATGKTVVGLQAIEQLSREADPGRPFTVRVFCHSLAILSQWRREFIDKLDLPVGTNVLGDRSAIHLHGERDLSVYFDTVQSVFRTPEEFPADLLIVDEVHHLGALEYSNALTVDARYKLGLSATVEGEERVSRLDKYLGPVCARYGLDEARRDGVIPSFEWILYPIPLATAENLEFRELTDRVGRLFGQISRDMETLRLIHGTEATPLQSVWDFFRALERARARRVTLPRAWEELPIVIYERRRVLYNSIPKLDLAVEVAAELGRNHKCLVYTMSIATAEAVAQRLSRFGVEVRSVHSELGDREREDALEWFRGIKAGALVAPRILDEGIDVPDADVGINIASSKSKLQLIQRLGRLLRKGGDGKKAPQFHHFVAVPQDSMGLLEEDAVQSMDDVSWAVDTSQRLNIPLRFADLATRTTRMEGGFKTSEEFLAHRFKEAELVALHSGSIRLGEILASYPENVVKTMVRLLAALPDGPLPLEGWTLVISGALEETEAAERAVGLPLNWYIYVLGGMEPRGIEAILQKAID